MANKQDEERLIVVAGATGKQGGAVARSLLDRGFRIRALTRNPQKPEAQALTNRGAEVVQGDMEDRSAMERALEGAWFNDVGYEADIAALRQEYPELTIFERYLRSHGWEGAEMPAGGFRPRRAMPMGPA
jgi:nucleoside-diphosphate-sugar epimerase